MGLLSASASFVRYAVEGDPPENFWDFAASQISRHCFRDIDDGIEEYSTGWVSILNMFDSEFAYASFAAGDYVVLTLRVDERKVAPAVIKKFCLKEEERLKKQRQVPKLSRGQKVEIKEQVTASLIRKAVPVTTTFDLCWNLAEGTLLFFSTNLKAQGVLEDLFKETFGLQLVLQIPYLTAAHMLAPDEQDALAAITPDIFV